MTQYRISLLFVLVHANENYSPGALGFTKEKISIKLIFSK